MPDTHPMPTEEDALCDKYGNPIDGDRLIYCCFPDCGCDGERLCMAENGASERAREQNVEDMYSRKDEAAKNARRLLIASIYEENKNHE